MGRVEIVKEVDHIEDLKTLRDAINGLPDDFPICDAMGEPLCLRVVKEKPLTGMIFEEQNYAEIV